MRYQFVEPFTVDSTKIADSLNVHATPVEQAMAETLATYHPKASAAPHRLHLPRPNQA
jgi:hypothetical protein